MIINVRYAGGFNPELDREVERIVGSESVSSGFFIPTGERDLQFDLEPEYVSETIDKLRAHGIAAEVRKPMIVR